MPERSGTLRLVQRTLHRESPQIPAGLNAGLVIAIEMPDGGTEHFMDAAITADMRDHVDQITLSEDKALRFVTAFRVSKLLAYGLNSMMDCYSSVAFVEGWQEDVAPHPHDSGIAMPNQFVSPQSLQSGEPYALGERIGDATLFLKHYGFGAADPERFVSFSTGQPLFVASAAAVMAHYETTHIISAQPLERYIPNLPEG